MRVITANDARELTANSKKSLNEKMLEIFDEIQSAAEEGKNRVKIQFDKNEPISLYKISKELETLGYEVDLNIFSDRKMLIQW